MNKEQLQKELKKFDKNLESKQNIDESLKENLKKLLNDVNSFLENPEDISEDEKENLLENLRDSTLNFETKHPEFSESIKIIIHTLSNMGI